MMAFVVSTGTFTAGSARKKKKLNFTHLKFMNT